MHIITQKRIWDAKKKYLGTASALDGWYRVVKKNRFQNFAEIRKSFNSVDKFGEHTVFDIGENKLRLISIIHYQRQKIYIERILSHKEYDQYNWK